MCETRPESVRLGRLPVNAWANIATLFQNNCIQLIFGPRALAQMTAAVEYRFFPQVFSFNATNKYDRPAAKLRRSGEQVGQRIGVTVDRAIEKLASSNARVGSRF